MGRELKYSRVRPYSCNSATEVLIPTPRGSVTSTFRDQYALIMRGPPGRGCVIHAPSEFHTDPVQRVVPGTTAIIANDCFFLESNGFGRRADFTNEYAVALEEYTPLKEYMARFRTLIRVTFPEMDNHEASENLRVSSKSGSMKRGSLHSNWCHFPTEEESRSRQFRGILCISSQQNWAAPTPSTKPRPIENSEWISKYSPMWR